MSKADLVYKCIYCSDKGLADVFDDEHVFSRSLCGTGENWTLINRVCKVCNNKFSRFETELLQQSAETIARAFNGPLGRSARSDDGIRIQPLKINHLYAININDPLVYEAGFSFPSEFYFRPQMIDVGDGSFASIVTNQIEINSFQNAVSRFITEPKKITLPRPKGQKDYEIATFINEHGRWILTERNLSKKPTNVFFREFNNNTNLPQMTSRLAQNDDGRLFIRAADLTALSEFMNLIYSNNNAPPRPALPPGQGNQTFHFGFQYDIIKVYKAILKTGLNLVAYLLGDVIEDKVFDKARNIVLEVNDSKEAGNICQMSANESLDFPKLRKDSHQMMLDEFKGHIRFRIKLYNNFSYTAFLAPLNESLRNAIGSKLERLVLIDYEKTGIQEVKAWI